MSMIPVRMKRRDQSTSSYTSATEAKKRKVVFTTYQKRKADLNGECQTHTWLDCDTEMNGRKKEVTKLRCAVCTKFKTSIASRRNFSEKWLLGADLVCTSNIRDHAKADQHTHAMNLLKRERARESGSDSSSYAPIARALKRFLTLKKTSYDTKSTSHTSPPSKKFRLGSTHSCVSWKHDMESPLGVHTRMRLLVKPSHIT